MQDRELYQRIAGEIAPWSVGEVKVESDAQWLEVQVECNDAVPKLCPHCESMLLVCDQGEVQTWRQPDAGPWQVFLKGRLPLVECPDHGVVRVSAPWADWYIRGHDRSLLGPWSLQQVKLLLDAGRISPSTLLKRSSTRKWVITGTIAALFVRQDETVVSPLSVDELAAVDWAIANGPADSISILPTASRSVESTGSMSIEPTASDYVATENNPSAGSPSSYSDDDQGGDSHKWPHSGRQTNQPLSGQYASLGQPELASHLIMLHDSNQDSVHESRPLKPLRFWTQRESEISPSTLVEQSHLELTLALEQDVEVEHTSKLIRSEPKDDSSTQCIEVLPRQQEFLPATLEEPNTPELILALKQDVEVEHTAMSIRKMPVGDVAAQRIQAPPREPEKLSATLNDRARLCSKEIQSPQPEPLSPQGRGEGTTSTIANGDLEEPSSPELTLALEPPVEMEHTSIVVRKKPVDDAAAQRVKAPREAERPPDTSDEPNPPDWDKALEQDVEEECTSKVLRRKPVNAAAARRAKAAPRRDKRQRVKVPPPHAVQRRAKAAPRREALVRRRGFQQGYQLLMIAYLINACLVSCLIPMVCTIFFSRLLLLSTSVFAPFEGGNSLQEGQLVACGLSALSVLVLIGFPIWHLVSNDGILWHYVPSALLGMIVGFGLSPEYLDEVCTALKWCEFGFGITTVGLTVYTLSAVPAQSRMSMPLIAAALLTALSVMALCWVRTGSMLTVQADTVPPLLRGALPDAPLYIFGLYGTLVLIPAAILIELYQHVDSSTRQFLIRTGVLLGAYLLAGLATLGTFVNGAGSGFFDVPLALVPLGCVNALSAAIPSSLSLLDPQYSVSED